MVTEMIFPFDLPDPTAKAVIQKRQAGIPDITSLKPKQKEAYEKMIEFCLKPGGGMFLLEGYAGTGKTYVLSRLVEWHLKTFQNKKVAVTAPTNKAVKVLYRSADYQAKNLDYRTIHSLLGLRENISPKGEISFKPDKSARDYLSEVKLLLIDEVSMLQDELFNLILPYCQKIGLKVIFMGDPKQIPPVGMTNSIPFTQLGRAEHNIEYFILDEVVRQALDNPIVGLTMEIRNKINAPKTWPLPQEKSNWGDGKGVGFLKSGEEREEVLHILEKLFVSQNFKVNADFAKVIAWRNKTVNDTNAIIRGMLYGDDIGKIVLGEKLIANSPIMEWCVDENGKEDWVIVFPTNEEFEVVNIELGTFDVDEKGETKIPVYRCLVKYLSMDNMLLQHELQIVHEEGMETYLEIVNLLKDHALSLVKRGGWELGQAWKEYYDFQKNFADCNYNYAITAHKSQGSTYDYAVVLESDINANHTVVERNRIKYTACSRPRFGLFIVY